MLSRQKVDLRVVCRTGANIYLPATSAGVDERSPGFVEACFVVDGAFRVMQDCSKCNLIHSRRPVQKHGMALENMQSSPEWYVYKMPKMHHALWQKEALKVYETHGRSTTAGSYWALIYLCAPSYMVQCMPYILSVTSKTNRVTLCGR